MASPGPPAIPPTPAINPVSRRLYVPAPDGSLTVRDGVQGAILANIALSGRAIDVVVNPDTNLVYALSSGGMLDVIDGRTNLLAASIPLGHEGMAIGLNTITSRVYVGTIDGLATVDGTSLTVVALLPGIFANPDIAVDEATNRIYMSSIAVQRVNVVDGFTNTLIGTVTVGDRPAGLGVDPITHRVYVANSGTPRRGDAGDSVTVIDGYRNAVAATIDLGRQDALGVEVDSAAGTVSVTMSSGPPVLIDLASNRLVAADPAGAAGLTAGLAASAPSTPTAADQPAMSIPVDTRPASNARGAAAYNLTIATDASPDLTDLGSLIDSATSRWATPREKVWALYYWTHILRRQSGPVVLHGFEVTDPVRNFNDYGFTMCSTVTGINQTLYEALGLRHQYWDICNHTVAAVEYDGRFHMIDNSMSNLVTTDDGLTLASVEEAAADAARLVRERSLYASSANGFLTGSDGIRSVADIASPVDGSTLNGFYRAFCAASLKFRDYYYNWNAGHRYVLNLREGESYSRSFQPLDTTPDYWISSEHVDAPDPASTFQNDAANRFGLRGNGRWSFAPALTADGWSRAAYRRSNIEPAADGGLRPSTPDTPSDLVYKVQAGNAIASQHIQAQFARSDALATAVVSISINHGETWTDLGSVGTALGLVSLAVNARDQVNAAYETLVRVRMTSGNSAPDGIRLAGLTIETITQVNTKALPHLNVGRNEIFVAAADQSETMALWPDLRGELWRKDVYAASNIATQPVTLPRTYTAVAYPAVLTQDATLTYRMVAPTDITRLVYGGRLHNYAPGSYIDFLHSFDGGATWIRSYRLSDIAKPYDVVHYETVTDIPAGARTVLFRYLLHNTNPTAARATGLYAVRMEADHRSATDTPAPVAVTFRWRELQADRNTVARSHKQLITAYPLTYVIDVGGSDHPIMDSISTSVAAADDGAAAGYSDGLDAGGDKYVFSRRTDGANLARDKPYTFSRPPSGFQSSAPPSNATVLTDGVVGAPASGGISYWSGQCWSSGLPVDLQLDLGVPQAVGAMRAHLFGYPGWDALKGQVQDTAEVSTSLDGSTFTSRGFLQTSLWRKDIPINYMLPDDEKAAAWNFELRLPAPIAARYVRYRLTPKRTLCASELQVFDHVDYTPFDIRIAPPRAITGGPVNTPPSVSLLAPLPGAQFVTPATVEVAAAASDTDDGLRQVDFFAGPTLIGSAISSPYVVFWTDAAPGLYTLTARATDASGATTTSAPVHVIIAAPGDMVAIPDVVGSSQASAKVTLASLGLAAGPITMATSPTAPAGTVMGQAPAAGGTAVKGTAVSLVVSAGLGGVVVPSVVGQGHPAAVAALAEAGLAAGALTTAASPTAPAGNVISQSPAAGAIAPAGSPVALVVSSGATAPELPSPWRTQDVGAVGRAGSSAFIPTGATFSLSGSGADIWGTADAFRYLYRALEGDGAIVARVASVQNVSTWVKAGVMIRTDTSPGSAQAMMMVTPSKGNNFQRRTAAGGLSVGTAGAVAAAPYWVKLTRSGNTLTASQSSNGTSWTTVGSETIAMPAGVLVGLAVSSHVAGTLATATFDRVAVTDLTGRVLIPDIVGLSEDAAGQTLAAAGLAIGPTARVPSDLLPTGGVISLAPEPGTPVLPGSAVALVVSAGISGGVVPDVRGLSVDDATVSILAAGLTPGTIAAAPSAVVPNGSIISQTPPAGTTVLPGAAVGFVLSSGPGTAVVPDVTGLTQAAASAAIDAAALSLGAIAVGNSATVPAGSVISQLPAAGTSVGSGATVTLVISAGPASVAIPNVVGLSEAAATAAIASAGLAPGAVTTASSSATAGTVIAQTPPSGTSVAPATAVALVVSLGPPPTGLPSPWTSQDIGAVGLQGSASFAPATGVHTVAGAGADIWGTADAYRYVYQPLSGDGQVVARVATVQNTNAWVKAGVMIRADATPGSAHATMMVTPAKGNNFQRRVTAGGVTTGTAGLMVTAPYWVRLTRTGNTITAAQSVDGTAWTTVGSETLTLPATVLVGLAVSSHSASTLASATFDRVSVATLADLAPPVVTATPAGGVFAATIAVTLTASKPSTIRYTVDGTVPTTASPIYSGPLTVAATTTLRYVAVDAAGNQSAPAIQQYQVGTVDTTPPVITASPAGGTFTVSVAVALSASEPATIRYTLDGSAPGGASQLYTGPILLTSTTTLRTIATDAAGNQSSDQQVYTIAAANGLVAPWTTQDVGAVGKAGSATFTAATSAYALTGAGADIWGTADAFRFVSMPLSGDGEIVARVVSVQNTNAWVKAGVMIRASLAAGAAQAMMMVTPGKGNNFQRRVTTGGPSVGTAGLMAAAPYWVKLTRSANTVTAYQSADGISWSMVGSETIVMNADVLVGLVVSSHSSSTLATAAFDGVSVGPLGAR